MRGLTTKPVPTNLFEQTNKLLARKQTRGAPARTTYLRRRLAFLELLTWSSCREFDVQKSHSYSVAKLSCTTQGRRGLFDQLCLVEADAKDGGGGSATKRHVTKALNSPASG